jgi:FlaA1/EpsC-like NDP-sugar epimerase
MGQPIKIVDLAERLIRLSGLEPGRDVDIVFTGIRPGERLNEILFAQEEPSSDIGIDGVVAAKPVCPSLPAVQDWIAKLRQALETSQPAAVYGLLREAVPNFTGDAIEPKKLNLEGEKERNVVQET